MFQNSTGPGDYEVST